ncbi:hypothetical protein SNE35_02505 [Paucibacter sp. R3-3]|uniref:Uncharacterized protein n=1 Tax=Roseateles agri TaxID=3098619 RepID=A0ABU5DC50_9BURK|nr:hypothetical protein [Paucibacter sp. R3-3]MDY0743356.1 hypothetical protein [Paucibacter sp. R3-3]
MRATLVNQLIMNGGVIVAEVASVRAGWRTWIAVHAVPVTMLLDSSRPPGTLHIPGLDVSKLSSEKKFIFTLKRVSVDEEYLRNGWDVGGNESIDIFLVAYSFEELTQMLSELEVDTGNFTEAWNSDYPL